MCDCIKQMAEQIKSQTEQYGAIHHVGIVHIPTTFGGKVAINGCEQIFWKKKNGDAYKNPDVRPFTLKATYCPFCGQKYEEVD